MVDGAILEGSCMGNYTVGSNPIPSEKTAELMFWPFFVVDEDENPLSAGSADFRTDNTKNNCSYTTNKFIFAFSYKLL